jgi:hypothetical protein
MDPDTERHWWNLENFLWDFFCSHNFVASNDTVHFIHNSGMYEWTDCVYKYQNKHDHCDDSPT